MRFYGSILFELVSLVVAKGSLQLIPLISLAGLFHYPHMDNSKTIWGGFTFLVFATKTCWDTWILQLTSKQVGKPHHFYFQARNELCKTNNEKNRFLGTYNVIRRSFTLLIWFLCQFWFSVNWFTKYFIYLPSFDNMSSQDSCSLVNICLFFDIFVIIHLTSDKRNNSMVIQSQIYFYINL